MRKKCVFLGFCVQSENKFAYIVKNPYLCGRRAIAKEKGKIKDGNKKKIRQFYVVYSKMVTSGYPIFVCHGRTILCPKKNDALVELTLPKDTNIYAQQYALCLPDKEELQAKLIEWVNEFEKDK